MYAAIEETIAIATTSDREAQEQRTDPGGAECRHQGQPLDHDRGQPRPVLFGRRQLKDQRGEDQQEDDAVVMGPLTPHPVAPLTRCLCALGHAQRIASRSDSQRGGGALSAASRASPSSSSTTSTSFHSPSSRP